MFSLDTLNTVVVATGLITTGALGVGGAAGAICGAGASKKKSAGVRAAAGSVFSAVTAASTTLRIV